MGDDAPLAALSTVSRAFSDYFRQRFAQVTNPPIDPLRERIVMSLDSYLGRRLSMLTETPQHAQLLRLSTPLLTEAQLDALRSLQDPHFRSRTFDTTFSIAEGPSALEATLDRLTQEAVAAIDEGITLLILSDCNASIEQAPVPMAIAMGAVHHELLRRGLRTHASLLCETGSICDIHQIAVLLGYGAEAIVPTLALSSVRALAGDRHLEQLTQEQATERYFHAVEEGLRKVMARMGISTLHNIVGAGQFEIVGLTPQFVERCFTGSANQSGNITFAHIAEGLIAHCTSLQQGKEAPEANAKRRKLSDVGRYRFRRDAEYHAFNPLIIRALQKAAQTGSSEDYHQFTSMVYKRPPTALRDLLAFVPRTPVPGACRVDGIDTNAFCSFRYVGWSAQFRDASYDCSSDE